MLVCTCVLVCCVPVYVCAHARVGTRSHPSLCMWRSEANLWCHFSRAYFFEAASLTTSEVCQLRPDWLAIEPQGSCKLFILKVGITHAHHHARLLFKLLSNFSSFHPPLFCCFLSCFVFCYVCSCLGYNFETLGYQVLCNPSWQSSFCLTLLSDGVTGMSCHGHLICTSSKA